MASSFGLGDRTGIMLAHALREHTDKLQVSMQRLASGLRITSPSDDPAGYQLAASLDTNSRLYQTAVRNVSDGISYLNIAQTAAAELDSILTRLKELSGLAMNGSYTTEQRRALDSEASALQTEYNRIVGSTTWNNEQIFTNNSITIQAGVGAGASYLASLVSAGNDGFAADGTFTSDAAAGGSSSDVQARDVNNDGILDLVAAVNAGAGGIEVSLGYGDGTFADPVRYDNELYRKVELADFNNDGYLDILAARYGAATAGARLFLNDGDGTFTETRSFSPFTDFPGISIGDVNNDGKTDFFIGTDAEQGRLYLGDGAGNFSVSATLAYGGCWSKLSDVNNDGKLDLIVNDNDGVNTHLSVALGAGNGTFGARVTLGHLALAGGPIYTGIVTGDFNGDSKVDIAAATYEGDSIQVFLGAGNGTFGARVSYRSGDRMGGLVSGDFNGDGKMYLAAVATSAADPSIVVHFGAGNGTFGAPVSYDAGGTRSHLAALDLNSDGITDLLAGAESGAGILYGNSRAAPVTGVLRVEEIEAVHIGSAGLAALAYDRFHAHQNNLSLVAGVIGAGINRSEYALSIASSFSQEYGNAAARIRDVDVAAEVAEMVRHQMLVQGASALFAQANLQQKNILALLEGLGS